MYRLEEYSKDLSNLIGTMILGVTYKFKELEKENELAFYGLKQVKGKAYPLVLRSGMPQGLSMSPLLSTLAMEFLPPHEGLIMYADDGMFFSEDPEEFYFYMETLGGYGVSIESSKTGLVDKEREVKFLGTYINFSKQTVRWEDKTISFDDPKLDEFLKTISSKYSETPYAWE